MAESDGEVLRAFLIEPHSRSQFRAFFALCYRHTSAYLRLLRVKGWRLPQDQFQQESALEDLTLDILGHVLHGGINDPCRLVFGYFTDQQVVDFEHADPDDLCDVFVPFLHRHIRQQIWWRFGEKDPQAAKLKRRIKGIIKTDSYVVADNNPGKFVYSRESDRNLRPDKPLLPVDVLDTLVRQAFSGSRNRSEWCRRIFERLDAEDNYRNGLVLSDLLRTAVAVNAEHADLHGRPAGGIAGPRDMMMQDAIEAAVTKVLDWTEGEVLTRYVDKRKLTPDEAQRFLRAVDCYLRDVAQGDGHDKLPRYFREVMPESCHATYREEHKHVFETTIQRAQNKFTEILKKNPTFRRFRDYS